MPAETNAARDYWLLIVAVNHSERPIYVRSLGVEAVGTGAGFDQFAEATHERLEPGAPGLLHVNIGELFAGLDLSGGFRAIAYVEGREDPFVSEIEPLEQGPA